MEGYERDIIHRMNDIVKRGALKSVLNNRLLDVNAKKCLSGSKCSNDMVNENSYHIH